MAPSARICSDSRAEGRKIRFHPSFGEVLLRILEKIKDRFGTLVGSISDMRARTLKAMAKVFHGIYIRVCLPYFLRDLEKDLLPDLNTDLGIMINRV